MARAQVRNLQVPMIRAVSALRQITSKLADTDPQVPEVVLGLEEALAHFERIIYGKHDAYARRLAFSEKVLFNHTDLGA